jgi:hypothetical protein
MIRRLLVAARSWPQCTNAELMHHVLLILFIGERNWRRRLKLGGDSRAENNQDEKKKQSMSEAFAHIHGVSNK